MIKCFDCFDILSRLIMAIEIIKRVNKFYKKKAIKIHCSVWNASPLYRTVGITEILIEFFNDIALLSN